EVSRGIQVDELPLAFLRRLYLPGDRHEALCDLFLILFSVTLERLHALPQLHGVKHVLLENLEYSIFQKMRRDLGIAARRDVLASVHFSAGAGIALVRSSVVNAPFAGNKLFSHVAAI